MTPKYPVGTIIYLDVPFCTGVVIKAIKAIQYKAIYDVKWFEQGAERRYYEYQLETFNIVGYDDVS
jgi:hypothetical protein